MKSLNNVCLTGKIVGTPELRYLQSGTAILKFRFCFWTSRKTGDVWKEIGNFIDVTQFKPSENFAKMLHDKTSLAISGQLEMDEWEDKSSGQKRTKLQLLARDMCFIGSKSDNPKEHDTLAPIDNPQQGTIPLDQGDQAPF